MPKHPAHVFLTNTLTGEKELFIPLKPGFVSLYSCGPTVYGQQHIGNMRAVVFSDTLARTLKAAQYRVKRVINITDVSHLVGEGPTRLELHKNAPGYRLILNNILFPAAKKKERKT